MHTLTRLEGFEMGTLISLLGDENIGLVTLSSAADDKITGDYGCLITQDGATLTRIRLALAFEGNGVAGSGDGSTSTTLLFGGVGIRLGIKFKAYPDTNGRVIMQLEGAGGAARSVFTMSTTGVVTLDGVAGSTAFALNTWYEWTLLYSSAASGSCSMRQRAYGAAVRQQEFTNVTPAANGTLLRLSIGKNSAVGTYIMAVDDIAIEGAATVAGVDYPVAGRILALDPNGDGFYDGVWGSDTNPNAWQSVQRPHDADGTRISISGAGGTQRLQTFTLTTPQARGIPDLINGVQFCQTVKKDNANNPAVHIITRRGVTDIDLTSTEQPSGTVYNFDAFMAGTCPFTSLPWTLLDFAGLETGAQGSTTSATTILRVSTVFLYVDFDTPPDTSGGSASLPSGGGGSEIPPGPDFDRFCASIIFDPGGPQEYDLSGRLTLARPLRQERDILLRDYRASDADLEFADTDEQFIETNPTSFLRDPATGQPNWLGKRVIIALRMGTTVLTRFIGQVLEEQSTRGRGYLKIADRFQAMFDRPLLANTVGRIVSTTGAVGLGPSINVLGTNAPVSGWYLGNLTLLNQAPTTRNQATKCQTWTLTFTSEAIPDGTTHPAFFITGSITGFDGEGQHGVPGSYVSRSGQISINTDRVTGDVRESYLGVGPGNAPKGSTTSLRTVWRPGLGSTAVSAMRALLLDWRGANLTAAEIDASLDALVGTAADQALPTSEFIPTIARMSFDETFNLLAAVQALALHLGCSFIEKANGNIGVASFMPRVIDEPAVLCNSSDLMELAIAHLPIYNQYSVEHAFSESNDKFTQGFASPSPSDNDSFEKYDKIFPAPSAMQFRGYDASNLPWMQSIALALYDRYKDPRRIYSVRAKAERLSADMGDVFRIDSLVPTIGPRFTEPVSIDRNITGDLTTGMDLVEVDSEIVSGECGGYLGLDTDQTGLDDDCWGVF